MRFEERLLCEFVEVTEHGTVVHVMAVHNDVIITEVRSIGRRHVNCAGQAALPVNVVACVVQVILSLHNRVIDMRIFDAEPSAVILHGIRQGLLRLLNLLGSRKPLDTRVKCPVLRVDLLIQRVPCVGNQNGTEQRRRNHDDTNAAEAQHVQ